MAKETEKIRRSSNFSQDIKEVESKEVISPMHFLCTLADNQTSNDELFVALTTLSEFLKKEPTRWILTFGQKELAGLQRILDCFYYKTDIDVNRGEKIHLECVKCVKELLSKRTGLQLVVTNKEIIQALCKSLDNTFPAIMIAALESLAIICFSGDGHKHILQILTELNGEHEGYERFNAIIDSLTVNNDVLACSCLKLTNAIINSSNNLELRLHLRNEFMRAGLRDVLKDIEEGRLTYKNLEAKSQLEKFHRYRIQDCDKLFNRFDSWRCQLDEIDDGFKLIKTSVLGTDCEPLLLSILQHLSFIREDPKIRVAYYRLIEECISQIVIHHSGCDPDFRTSRKVTIYVHPQIGQLPKKDEENGENIFEEFSHKLEEIVFEKQVFQDKIDQLESELRKYQINGTTAVEQQTNGTVSELPKPPEKKIEVRPSFLHSMRFKQGNGAKTREAEEKSRRTKDVLELNEKGKKKREEKKQVLQKIDRVARQAKVDRSIFRKSGIPISQDDQSKLPNGDNAKTSLTVPGSSKIITSIPKTVNEEKPPWH